MSDVTEPNRRNRITTRTNGACATMMLSLLILTSVVLVEAGNSRAYASDKLSSRALAAGQRRRRRGDRFNLRWTDLQQPLAGTPAAKVKALVATVRQYARSGAAIGDPLLVAAQLELIKAVDQKSAERARKTILGVARARALEETTRERGFAANQVKLLALWQITSVRRPTALARAVAVKTQVKLRGPTGVNVPTSLRGVADSIAAGHKVSFKGTLEEPEYNEQP